MSRTGDAFLLLPLNSDVEGCPSEASMSRPTDSNPVGNSAGHYGLLTHCSSSLSWNLHLVRLWSYGASSKKLLDMTMFGLAVLVLSSKHYSMKTTSGQPAFPPLLATPFSLDDPMDCYTGRIVILPAKDGSGSWVFSSANSFSRDPQTVVALAYQGPGLAEERPPSRSTGRKGGRALGSYLISNLLALISIRTALHNHVRFFKHRSSRLSRTLADHA